MTHDQITVSRELLQLAYAEILHLSRLANVDHTERSIMDALRTALEQPAVEPIAYRYKYLNFMGQEVWSFDYPRGQDAKVLETQAVYTAAPQAQQPVQELISWGVDWGSHGDRSCVSIIKKHANGALEVVATEYGPVGSAPQAQQPAPVQEPLFWVLLRSDGMYEGPIHNAQIEKVRKESGGWTPLYTAPQAQQPGEKAAK